MTAIDKGELLSDDLCDDGLMSGGDQEKRVFSMKWAVAGTVIVHLLTDDQLVTTQEGIGVCVLTSIGMPDTVSVGQGAGMLIVAQIGLFTLTNES